MLVSFGALTQKQVVRMGDSDLLTEITQLLISGIVNKSEPTLKNLYKDNDITFAMKDECTARMHSVLDFIRGNLGDFAGGFLFKSYVLYSLCAALMYNRWGAPTWADNDQPSSGHFWEDVEAARTGLNALCDAHETQDINGPYAEYVVACLSTTHRVAQRQTRANWLLRALNGHL